MFKYVLSQFVIVNVIVVVIVMPTVLGSRGFPLPMIRGLILKDTAITTGKVIYPSLCIL